MELKHHFKKSNCIGGKRSKYTTLDPLAVNCEFCLKTAICIVALENSKYTDLESPIIMASEFTHSRAVFRETGRKIPEFSVIDHQFNKTYTNLGKMMKDSKIEDISSFTSEVNEFTIIRNSVKDDLAVSRVESTINYYISQYNSTNINISTEKIQLSNLDGIKALKVTIKANYFISASIVKFICKVSELTKEIINITQYDYMVIFNHIYQNIKTKSFVRYNIYMIISIDINEYNNYVNNCNTLTLNELMSKYFDKSFTDLNLKWSENIPGYKKLFNCRDYNADISLKKFLKVFSNTKRNYEDFYKNNKKVIANTIKELNKLIN